MLCWFQKLVCGCCALGCQISVHRVLLFAEGEPVQMIVKPQGSVLVIYPWFHGKWLECTWRITGFLCKVSCVLFYQGRFLADSSPDCICCRWSFSELSFCLFSASRGIFTGFSRLCRRINGRNIWRISPSTAILSRSVVNIHSAISFVFSVLHYLIYA